MKIKVLTLRFSREQGRFEEGALEEFLKDKELLCFREHFFSVDGVPHLTCVIGFGQPQQPPSSALASDTLSRSSRRDRPDPKEGLSEAQRALFERLRDWRAKKAHRDGQPIQAQRSSQEPDPSKRSLSSAKRSVSRMASSWLAISC